MTEVEKIEEIDIKDALLRKLVVFNDNHNTFQWVIIVLCDVLGHTVEQAEQCAWIVHTKGKCSVKDGEYKTLKPFKESICEKGIDAKII